eukprot:gene33353-41157_t
MYLKIVKITDNKGPSFWLPSTVSTRTSEVLEVAAKVIVEEALAIIGADAVGSEESDKYFAQFGPLMQPLIAKERIKQCAVLVKLRTPAARHNIITSSHAAHLAINTSTTTSNSSSSSSSSNPPTVNKNACGMRRSESGYNMAKQLSVAELFEQQQFFAVLSSSSSCTTPKRPRDPTTGMHTSSTTSAYSPPSGGSAGTVDSSKSTEVKRYRGESSAMNDDASPPPTPPSPFILGFVKEPDDLDFWDTNEPPLNSQSLSDSSAMDALMDDEIEVVDDPLQRSPVNKTSMSPLTAERDFFSSPAVKRGKYFTSQAANPDERRYLNNMDEMKLWMSPVDELKHGQVAASGTNSNSSSGYDFLSASNSNAHLQQFLHQQSQLDSDFEGDEEEDEAGYEMEFE